MSEKQKPNLYEMMEVKAPAVISKIERLTLEQEAQRADWRYRAISATKGNQTQLGAVLLAVLGKAPTGVPKFVGSATITSDGYITANFIDKSGTYHTGAFVCDVEDLQRNFSGLADHLNFSDADRIAMFTKVREWIFKDYRQDTMLHFTKKEGEK